MTNYTTTAANDVMSTQEIVATALQVAIDIAKKDIVYIDSVLAKAAKYKRYNFYTPQDLFDAVIERGAKTLAIENLTKSLVAL